MAHGREPPIAAIEVYRLRAQMRPTSANRGSMVNRVGQDLRDERERQGKRLDDVARAIKIHPNYLAAIEQGRFDDLPDSAFSIGYACRYARYLQLDVRGIAEWLEAEIAARGGVPARRITVEPLSDRTFPVLGIVVAGLLLIAVAGDDVVSLPTRAVEQVQRVAVPVPIGQQAQLDAPNSPSAHPFEVEVTEAVSLRPELLPPLPQIVATRPVSLRADLTPSAVRRGLRVAPLLLPMPVPDRIAPTPRASLRAGLLPQAIERELPPGRRYGLQNRNSRITLRVHSPTIVAIRDARNRIFIDRRLAPGDTYRVPNRAGLWLTAIDAGAVEIVLDGVSVGFAGAQGATVRDLSLNPQSIASRARPPSR